MSSFLDEILLKYLYSSLSTNLSLSQDIFRFVPGQNQYLASSLFAYSILLESVFSIAGDMFISAKLFVLVFFVHLS
jgi:hypothetical protein